MLSNYKGIFNNTKDLAEAVKDKGDYAYYCPPPTTYETGNRDLVEVPFKKELHDLGFIILLDNNTHIKLDDNNWNLLISYLVRLVEDKDE